MFSVSEIGCESNTVFSVKKFSIFVNRACGTAGNNKKIKHVKFSSWISFWQSLSSSYPGNLPINHGSPWQWGENQVLTFENWILLCALAGGNVRAAKKDHNQPPGSHQLNKILQRAFSVRFGWFLPSTYKCCWQAMGLGFQHLAFHKWAWFYLKIIPFPSSFLQLTTEDFLTADELGWFPGCLVLGQVLGILLGPLLADLVKLKNQKWQKYNNPKFDMWIQVGRRITCLLAAVASFASWVLLSTRFLSSSSSSCSSSYSNCSYSCFWVPHLLFFGPLLQFSIPLKVSSIMFFTSQLGWALLLARTLTGLTDSLVT